MRSGEYFAKLVARVISLSPGGRRSWRRLSVYNWAMSRLISRAEATGNSRATLPFVAMPERREVGAQNRRWFAIRRTDKAGREGGELRMSREKILDYDLVRSPNSEMLDRVFRLRARAWKARTQRFPTAIDAWQDAFDGRSLHFVACTIDDAPVAAARLTIAESVGDGPDQETYGAVPKDQLVAPFGFMSRLVVCPDHAGRGLSQALDKTRLRLA